MKLISLFWFIVAFSYVHSDEIPPIIKIKNGQIRGYQKTTVFENLKVNIYEGIPYAKPPVGELRFKKPQPVESWTGIYNATHYRYACWCTPNLYPDDEIPQSHHFSEDCLFLTVYSPAKECKQKLPVMMWIHGGGFETGSAFSIAYDASYIAAIGEVVVVTINYRLGAFGFLYGGNEDAPGNMGFHDQILALKWIKENIKHFGGDSNKITIFGQSAGGMSTGSLVLSPKTKGLIQRAIVQSGAPNSFMGSQTKKQALQKTKDLATKLNCTSEKMEEIVRCLRKLSPIDIINVTKYSRRNAELLSPIFGDEVIPKRPIDALKNGDFDQNLDLMFGLTNNEGSVFAELLFPNYLSPFSKHPNITKKQAYNLIQLMFMVFKIDNPSEVADFYTKHIDDSDIDGLRRSVANAFGDYHLVCPTIFFGEAFGKKSRTNNIFAYRLTHRPSVPSFKECVGYMGVCHGDDIVLLFGFPIRLRGIVYSEDDYHLSLDMIRAWTHFAYHGNPGQIGSLHWKPAFNHSLSNPSVIHFRLDIPSNYKMIYDYYVTVCDKFWKNKIFV